MNILVLDNYDSFTYNLVHYIEELVDEKVDVFRNDEIDLNAIEKYDKIVLSPGPGLPKDAGILEDVIRKYAPTKSIFGVCLGMQAIGEVYGARLNNLNQVYHGVATAIDITDANDATFQNMDTQLEVGRYHSWVVDRDSIPNELQISSEDHNGEVMSLYHKEYDLRGVQFHPESILTPEGKKMLQNWLEIPVKKVAKNNDGVVNSKKKSLKNTLDYLHEGFHLDYSEARERLSEISNGEYTQEEVTEFITSYILRDITATELTGFRDALFQLAIKPDFSDFRKIDLCGTGGDGKSTFNISTLTSFVVAGAGYKVVKHGNYGVSSKSGSSNVLEYFGAKFTNEEQELRKQVESSNFTYLHAPLFHPAMKHVAPIRKKLGVKTFFNMLGPLLNPASPECQFTGVYSPEVAALYRDHFENTDCNYLIVHSNDGYDEVSLTDNVLSYSNVIQEKIGPALFGTKALTPESLVGGNSIEEAAAIFKNVLYNKATPAQTTVVVANAALAIQCFEPSKSIEECMQLAKEALESGRAKVCFESFVGQK